MNEFELTRAREEFRATGTVSEALFAELSAVAERLVRFGHLPASYAPYGVWDEEARDEIFQAWVTDKLLRAGGLHALLDRARTVKSLRRLAERSLRQHVLNARARSQTQNLYWRCVELLENETAFVVVTDATRPQDRVWGISGKPRKAFSGEDRELLGLAWSLGDFEPIRYRAGAEKLSPVISTPDLERFLSGLIEAAGPLTLTQIVQALKLRFGLAEVALETLDEAVERPEPASVDELAIQREDSLAVISELTSRQVRVLLGRRAEVTLGALAEELECSPATISNEARRIASVIERHARNEDEKQQLLKVVGDSLYELMG